MESSCCGSGGEVSALVSGKEWVPEFVKGTEKAAKPESGVFINFGKDGKMNGMSGENLFGGSYSISPKGEFKTDKVYSTRRAGPFMEYESEFLKNLSSAKTLRVSDDGKLEFLSDKNEVLMEMVEKGNN